MFKFRKKSMPIDVVDEPRKLVSAEYDRCTYLTTTNQKATEVLKVVVEKEELPYLDLNFEKENIVQAMVYSEIFGKPKSRRRKR